MRQEFFVRDKYFGDGERRVSLRTGSAPPHLAFFCPACGEIWARCPVNSSYRWAVCHSMCDKCGQISILDVPGSLWQPLDDDFNKALPRELLLREFDLALQYNQYLEKEGVQWNRLSSTTDAIFGQLASSVLSTLETS